MIAVSLLVGAIILSFLLPKSWLLPCALVSYAFLPVNYLPGFEILTVLTLPAAFILVWLMRADRRRVDLSPKRPVALSFLIVIGLIASCVVTISLTRSLAWSTAFLSLFLFPLFWAKATSGEVTRLKITWAVVVIVIAIYGAFEFALGANPVFGGFYASAEYPILQHWDSYRITTSLGHPLANMVFFSTSFGAMLGWYQIRPQWLALVALIAALFGVFMTVSRTGVIACAVVVAAAVVFPHVSKPSLRSKISRILIAVVGSVGVFFIANSEVFLSRSTSGDGLSSNAARDQLFAIVEGVAEEYGPLGSGPGTSNLAMQLAGRTAVVENSFLQLFLSLGLSVTVLIAILIARIFFIAIKNRRRDAALGLAALTIAMAGFNWIESVRPGMAFFGLLVALVFSEVDGGEKEDVGKVGSGARRRSVVTD